MTGKGVTGPDTLVGEATVVGPYEFTLETVENDAGPNYQTSIATIRVSRDGGPALTSRLCLSWVLIGDGRLDEAAAQAAIEHGKANRPKKAFCAASPLGVEMPMTQHSSFGRSSSGSRWFT